MKTVTVEQFLKFNPCYPPEQICKIAGNKTEWTALDVLVLEDVPLGDRFWAVLREEFLDAPILHEFACRCVEETLGIVNNLDEHTARYITVKREWLKGKVMTSELHVAREFVWESVRSVAAIYYVLWVSMHEDARRAAWETVQEGAYAVAWKGAQEHVQIAAQEAAWNAALETIWTKYLNILTNLLLEKGDLII